MRKVNEMTPRKGIQREIS